MRALAWFRERVPIDASALRSGLNEPIPLHLRRWWWALGGTPAYLFLVQVVTGILLTFYYVPNPDHAYASVRAITEEVAFGWWIRGLHRWSSNLMIAAVILHVMRVFFTGAYRRPRELTWVTGAFLLFVVLFFGFTGYSLVYEQLSYWGATVAGNLTAAVPLVGPALGSLLRGGETISDNTLTRFFVLHIGILPTLFFLLIVVHLSFVRLHGVSDIVFRDEADRRERTFPFFPDHLLMEIGIGVALTFVLTCLTLIVPPALGEPADPLHAPAHIKPEWYFYFTFRWLKWTGLTFAVLTLGLGAFLFVAWPWVDRALARLSRGRDLSVPLGVLVFVGLIVLTLVEAAA